MDENVDYEERESEFDVEDEDRSDAGLDNDGEKQDQAIEVRPPVLLTKLKYSQHWVLRPWIKRPRWL